MQGISDAHIAMLDRFQQTYAAMNPDFQTKHADIPEGTGQGQSYHVNRPYCEPVGRTR